MTISPKDRPRPIRTSPRNAFANHTVRARIPAILAGVSSRNPDYPPSIHAAIAALRDELESDAPLSPLPLPAPDAEEWDAALASREDDRWQDTDWYFAESYVYRRLMSATRFFETERDPFAPDKQDELASAPLWGRVEAALSLEGPLDDRLPRLFHLAMWGNRIDLSYAAAASHGTGAETADLLTNDAPEAAAHLARAPGPVHVLCDNAGTELALDLCLTDALLQAPGTPVALHVKQHPTFVSDATARDVRATLAAFGDKSRHEAVRKAGERLSRAFDEGRLTIHPDPFWNSWRFFWEAPSRITRALRPASLCIVKGDANYRRLLGDALWPAETPFSQVVGYFPCPLLALRTLKSDPVVGLLHGQADQLDRDDASWRVNGKRAVAQAWLMA